MPTPLKVFLSSTRADEGYRKRLEVALASLKRERLIELWHDQMLLPSADAKAEVRRRLVEADIVLLLVSPDLLASDDSFDTEIDVALERHQAGAARVIPILLRPTDHRQMPFAGFVPLPSDGRPISAWRNADEAWLDVVRGIRRVIEALVAMKLNRQTPENLSSERKKEKYVATPSQSIKVLFLGAAPVDQIRLALGKEVRSIRENLRESEAGRRFELIEAWAVRSKDLQRLLLEHEPPIVHFSGHGDSSGALMFEGDDGRARYALVDAVAGLFSLFRDRVRCVVLNACYSEPQAKAICEHIDCVVGMKSAIYDDAARNFSSSFYLGLGYGRSVKDAFDLGCNQIALAGTLGADLPTLLCRPGIEASALTISPARA